MSLINRRDAETRRGKRFRLGVSASLRFIVLLPLLTACRVPTLESQQCRDASLAVKEFYSFHFGNDMAPTAENLNARHRFLTDQLYGSVSAASDGKTDYFTKSAEYPKTFKIGKCEAPDAEHANVQVQEYWLQEHGSTKDTIQRSLEVSTVKTGDNWLINSVAEGRPD